MPLLSKRNNKPLIPPVESELRADKAATPRSQYQSNASSYVASRDGNLYGTRSSASRTAVDDQGDHDSYRDKYSRSNGVGDVYSRDGDAQLERDRSELFAGYNPAKSPSGSGRFFDGAEVAEGEEEDMEAIKTQTRSVKQESVNSTRNALMLARQAEETGRGTLEKLGSQSERLANTERHLDVSKGHSSRAADATDELKQLNRSIFRPVVTFNKDKKRLAAEARIQARYDEERAEREKAMLDVRETQNRLGRAQTYGRGMDDDEGIMGPGRQYRTEDQLRERKEHRKRFQFEATASDDEMEDELDDNLDEIGDAAGRLKALGLAMNQELDAQNKRLDDVGTKTDGLDLRLAGVTRRQKKF